jgi:hypothetical protein
MEPQPRPKFVLTGLPMRLGFTELENVEIEVKLATLKSG